MNKQELAGAGVEAGTVRISIGLEDSADLIEDLRQALG
jgi:O-acetylhomoserine (thiol)-lyase